MVGFHVLTEFSFDGGAAIAESEKMQAAVAGISTAADDAILSFKHLGMATIGSMGFGKLGLLGALESAIHSSDKFRQSQISMAQLMNDGVTPFVQRMGEAETIMGRINKLANEFALPADEMMQMVKLTAPMLRTSSGAPNFSLATDLSRNVLKAAPTLGVQPSLIMGQLQGMIGGFTSRNDTLFQRLTGDTKSMKGMSSQAFNQLPEPKRIELMIKAMGEFTKDTKALEANVRTLHGQLTILKNQLIGMFSVLKPIGDLILKIVVPALAALNAYIEKTGKEFVVQITRMIEPWMGSVKNIYVNLMALKSLKGNVDFAAHIIKLATALSIMAFVVSLLGIQIPIVTTALMGWASIMGGLTALRMLPAGGGIFMMLNRGFAYLTGILTTLLGPLFLLVLGFQILSRAWAMWKYDSFVKSAEGLAKFADMMARISNMIAIFVEGMDVVASGIASLGSWALGIESINSILDVGTTIFGLALAAFEGLALGIMEFINQIKGLMTGKGFHGGQVADAFNFGVDDTIQKVFGKIKPGDAIASNVTNIDTVNINNNIKTQMEPDRLAFTVVDQLKKISQNPNQAAGRSLQPVGR